MNEGLLQIIILIFILPSNVVGKQFFVNKLNPGDDCAVVDNGKNCTNQSVTVSDICACLDSVVRFVGEDDGDFINFLESSEINATFFLTTSLVLDSSLNENITMKVFNGFFNSSYNLTVQNTNFLFDNFVAISSHYFISCEQNLHLVNGSYYASSSKDLQIPLVRLFKPSKMTILNVTFENFRYIGNCFSTIYIGDSYNSSYRNQSKSCGFGYSPSPNDFSDDLCPAVSTSLEKRKYREHIKSNSGDLLISNVTFKNMYSAGSGGAFHFNQRCAKGSARRTIEINDATFISCSAQYFGGGFYIVTLHILDVMLTDPNVYEADGVTLRPQTLPGGEPAKRKVLRFDYTQTYGIERGIDRGELSKRNLATEACTAVSVSANNCSLRGSYIFIEVLEDVVFPFNSYLYYLDGYILSTTLGTSTQTINRRGMCRGKYSRRLSQHLS